ncbi:MAG: FGGY-family carbohydrate kinase, partial [Psychromonas sp.]
GGTFMKACLFDQNGQQVALSRTSASVINEQQGWVERDLDALWADARLVLQDLLKQADVAAEQVKGISISAQGKGVYLLDKQGQNLRNGIISSDSRSIDIVREWQQQGVPEKIYSKTLQTLWTGHPVSIVRWLKENEPQNYQNIGSIMMAHDYIRYRLTDQKHAEITNMSESNFYNADLADYDPQLLATFGIEEVFAALPPLIKPDQLAGTITEKVAEEIGLIAGTPVFGGLFDVVSTAICSGINSDEQKLNYVMGTWSVTSGITKKISPAEYNFVYGHYAVQGEYIIHEASPTSASNYEWFSEYFNANGEVNHAANESLVAQLPAAQSSLFFVPFLYGSNMGLGIKSGFYGLQSHHKKGDLIQAIWEGILFCHNVHLQRMRQRFPEAKTLRVTGGTTGSKVWMQMLADLTAMNVEIPNVEETGAFGAALVAMVGAGQYPSLDCALEKINLECKYVTPNPENFAKYQVKYKKYLKLVQLFKAFEEQNND